MDAKTGRRGSTALLIAWAIVACAPAVATERGSTPAGARYVSGGIGLSERSELHAERGEYRLWVATVARGSGAYLSDARVLVSPASGGAPIFDHTMAGPWLLVNLPPGRYTVTATLPATPGHAPITERAQVRVEPRRLKQAVLRFPIRTEVSPEQVRPFGGNPFGADTPH
jgi:hypothetical protein